MNDKLLSRNECNALRGIAIIGIFLHNYCHWLRGIVRENEYQYFQHNVDSLLVAVGNPDWNLPIHIVSFFGHYGVPVFLFLSAYGLVRKYESPGRSASESTDGGAWHFIRVHFLKLFKMMIVGYVAFTMVDVVTPGTHHYHVAYVLAQLGLVNNLLPNPDDIIWPGPYWFFGLMLQLYVVYRLVLHRRSSLNVVILMVACTALQAVFGPESSELNYLRYNFIGGMLPFGMGMLYARYGRDMSRQHYACVLAVGVLMLVLCSLNYYAWFFAPVAVIASTAALVKLQPASVNGVLTWMGSISAALFVCHPLTRKIFIPLSHRGDIYTGLVLYILASIALAWLFRELLKRIPNPR